MIRMRTATGIKVAWMLLLTVMAGAVPMISYASTTQEKINQAEQKKDELEGKLDDKQEELEGLKGEQNSLKGKLSSLNAQLTEVSNHLEDLEQQISDKKQEITDTKEALEQARQTEKQQYESMRTRIRYMYENSSMTYLEALFTAESIGDLLNAADRIERVAQYDRRLLEQYEENRKFIESEEARLQSEKEELDHLQAQAAEEQNRVSGLIDQTSKTISQYADQISDAEQEALNYEAAIRETEKDLEYLKKKLAEEIAMSQRAANAKWRDISEVDFSEGDRKLLANLIYCEAGAEPYDGKLAVGSVVINRVLSSVFPDTVVGVIYQSRQFSPVASGRLELALASDKANEDCYRAADAAIAGMNNVGSCVFFRTPVEGLTGISIGGHIFY